MKKISLIFIFVTLNIHGFAQSFLTKLEKKSFQILQDNPNELDSILFNEVLGVFSTIRQGSIKIKALEILSKELNFITSKTDTTSKDNIRIEFYNLLGAYYESTSNYEKALKALYIANSINQSKFYTNDKIFTYNYLGYVYWHKSEYDSSFFYHNKALQLAKMNSLQNSNVAFTYLMLGNDYYDVGDYVKTSENYFESLKLYEKLNNTIGQLMVQNRLSKLYFKLKDYKSAKHHVQTSQQLNKTVQYHRELANSYNSLGNIEIEIGSLDSALFYFRKTLLYYFSSGDMIGQSIASINLGDTYLGLFNKNKNNTYLDSSFYYYQKSLQLNRLVDNKFGMIYGFWGMADNLINKGQIEQALLYYHEALKVSLLIKAKSEEYNLYWKMYKVFESNNQKDSSYYYLKKYTEVKMSIENEEKTKEFLRQESKYQIDKRVAEEAIKMEQQNLIIAEKNKWKNYVLIGVVFISLILIYLVAMSIKRMKIIAVKNEIINSINSALTIQNKEILDSINYAKRIQNAILPPQRLIKELLPESFVLYLPKDIVAGDFYWMETSPTPTLPEREGGSPPSGELEGAILFAAADCTGHGVPGAMVSVICNNGLNRSVREYGMTDPAQILEKTREIVIQEFEKSDEDVKDGMDIALCSLSTVSSSSGAYRELKYAGANNPLWIIRPTRHSGLDPESVKEIAGQARNDESQTNINGNFKFTSGRTGSQTSNFELLEVKSTKQHIGKVDQQKPFVTHTVELQKGDSIYIFTDGYQDQFGGEKGKKFKAAKLKTLLLSIQDKVMEEQKIIINNTFESWKGTLEQVDDVCIIGVRV